MAQRRSPGQVRVYDLWRRADGSPTKRDGTGKRWRVAWIDYDGRQKTESYDRKLDARQREKELVTELTRGAYVDPTRSRTSIGALYDEWEPTTVHIKPSTRITRKNRWAKHVAPYWTDREVGSIRKTDVQAWVSTMSETGAKPTTIAQATTLLRLVLEYAVDAGKLAANPARGVKTPRIVNRRHSYLTVKQVELLAKETGDAGTLVRLLAYTGLRWGEASALRVGDVDLDRRRLYVHRSDTTAGGKLVEGTTKTHQAREVPVVLDLVGPLRTATGGKRRGERVFTTESGTPLRADNFRPRVYRPALDRARELDGTMPVVTIHDLRHTAASLAVKAGGNVKAVQRMLGHASAAMTLDRYSDLFDDDLDALVGRLDGLISGRG